MMRTIVEINSDSDLTVSMLLKMATANATDTCVIRDARNRIWLSNSGDHRVVVKRFRRSFISRISYMFRYSKACKSYRNAIELMSRDVLTPEPLGYVEWRGVANQLSDSVYLCGYDEGISLREALDVYGRDCLSAFASYVAMLHEKGVVHDDLNDTNVRVVRTADGECRFSLIDLNRMRFFSDGAEIGLNRCFRNLCRFSQLDEDFRFFIWKYLISRKLPEIFIDRAVRIKRRHDILWDLRKCLKRLLFRRK